MNPQSSSDGDTASTSPSGTVSRNNNSSNGILANLQRRARRQGNSNSDDVKIMIRRPSSEGSRSDEVDVARRCLVIDDDAVVRAMLKRQLKVCFPSWMIETAEQWRGSVDASETKGRGRSWASVRREFFFTCQVPTTP
jgi:hypothetical protein